MRVRTIPTNPEAYVDDLQVAAMLGLSRSYLRQLRSRGEGCKFSRFGRAVRYRVADVWAWAESLTEGSTDGL